MSDDQRKTALRVAKIPDAEFEAAVEGDNPPTVTALAEKGTTKKLAVNAAADQAEATSAAAKAKPVAAPCVNACDEMPDVAAPQGTTPAGQRRFNFLYRASQAIDYGKQHPLVGLRRRPAAADLRRCCRSPRCAGQNDGEA